MPVTFSLVSLCNQLVITFPEFELFEGVLNFRNRSRDEGLGLGPVVGRGAPVGTLYLLLLPMLLLSQQKYLYVNDSISGARPLPCDWLQLLDMCRLYAVEPLAPYIIASK